MRKPVTMSSLLGLATLGLLATGCPDRTISEVNPEQGRVEYKDIPVTVNRNIDILFVIDDSVSMADKQTNIRENFPNFVNVLNTIAGGLPDLHIGVVSSDGGSKGSEDTTPGPGIGTVGQGGCSGEGKRGNLQLGMAGNAVQGTFISDIKLSTGERQKNYTGDLATVFGQMATIGAQGCGFEQHLEAMRRALANNPANAGFIRPDAYLAVIFLADEDDCSFKRASQMYAPESPQMGALQSFRCNRFGHICAVNGQTPDQMNVATGAQAVKGQCGPNENSAYLTKVADYVNFLKGLKSDPSKVIVAGILGTTEPYVVEMRAPPGGQGPPIPAVKHSCTYQGALGPEVADPPVRLKFFLDQFPSRSTFTTICQRDLSGGLQLIAQLLKTALGNPCIEGDLVTPYDCSVSDVTNYLKPNQSEKIIPSCESGNARPCWTIDVDRENCPAPMGHQGEWPAHILKIERNETPPPDTHVIAYCVTKS